jgi:adenine-specific DNA methylase
LLLASVLPAQTTSDAFWDLYAVDATLLSEIHAGDPFMGGATTLVEAARLGADVSGIDVDPLAVLIAGEELAEMGDPASFSMAAEELLTHMRASCGDLYGMADDEPTPVHYFYLRRVTCEDCGTESLLYRNPVLARDIGKNGGVVRRRGAEVFCPDCRDLRHLSKDRKGFRCCGRLHRLDAGTYERAAHTCPECGTRRRHEQLRTGMLPRELIAVEETVPNGRRRIRKPSDEDLKLINAAEKLATTSAARTPIASQRH